MALYDDRYPSEDASLREVATRIGIPVVALIVLALLGGGDGTLRSRSVLIGLVFLAAFSILVVLMRFEMGPRRFWLVGALCAFAALIVALIGTLTSL